MSKYYVREVVVITGASAGVGRATARLFARRRARVALLARGEDGLNATVREVEELGGEALAFSIDMADAGKVEAAAEQIVKSFGPIDIWINNAATTVFSEFKEMTSEEFRRVTEVTYLGYVHGTMAALRRMLTHDHGTIVQIASAMSERSVPLQSAYCGANAAIRGFTDSVRCELLHDKSRVHITLVLLPGLNTPQFERAKSRLPRKGQPLSPIFQPEVAAEAIVWASHRRRREVLVGTSTIKAVWGDRFIAPLLERYLAKAGYDGQMTDEPEEPDRTHSLWSPLPGDHGVHGPFNDVARGRSLQWEANRYKGWIGLGFLAACAAGIAVRRG